MANSGRQGIATPESFSGEHNAYSFLINQILNKTNTSTLVKIVSCTNSGAVSPVGFVDVVPMVHQVDGQGNPITYETVHNLPYLRIQGGANAIIMDPQPGDIGIAIFASRDISAVKSTKDVALPATPRKYALGDGMYIGGLLNGTPSQYIQFNAAGITIVSPNAVTVNAPTATVNSPVVAVNSSTSVDITSPQTTIHGKLTVTDKITGQNGAAVTGDTAVTGKINASNTIESAANLKVSGVTLNVP